MRDNKDITTNSSQYKFTSFLTNVNQIRGFLCVCWGWGWVGRRVLPLRKDNFPIAKLGVMLYKSNID